jgi:hypothetical protein
MQNSLYTRTQDLVLASPQSYREIATGAGVEYLWLWRFATGKVKTARGDDLQRVYEYLSGAKLELN